MLVLQYWTRKRIGRGLGKVSCGTAIRRADSVAAAMLPMSTPTLVLVGWWFRAGVQGWRRDSLDIPGAVDERDVVVVVVAAVRRVIVLIALLCAEVVDPVGTPHLRVALHALDDYVPAVHV